MTDKEFDPTLVTGHRTKMIRLLHPVAPAYAGEWFKIKPSKRRVEEPEPAVAPAGCELYGVVHPKVHRRLNATEQMVLDLISKAKVIEPRKMYRYKVPSNTISQATGDGWFSVSRIEYGMVLYATYDPRTHIPEFQGDGPFEIKPSYYCRFDICSIERFVEIINYDRIKNIYALAIPEGHRHVPVKQEA